MTEPSDAAVRLIHKIRTYGKRSEFAMEDKFAAREIDALTEQRIAAAVQEERERCAKIAYRCRVEADAEGKTADLDSAKRWRSAADAAGRIERDIRAVAGGPAPEGAAPTVDLARPRCSTLSQPDISEKQDSLRGLGVEQPAQDIEQPGCGYCPFRYHGKLCPWCDLKPAPPSSPTQTVAAPEHDAKAFAAAEREISRLTHENADLRAAMRIAVAAPGPTAGDVGQPHWTCFHCRETFNDPEDARLHFGDSCMSDSACQINIKQVREMERLHERHLAEDSDTDRAMYRMRAEHTVALRQEEEKGYALGLKDGRAELLAQIREPRAELVEAGLEAYWNDGGCEITWARLVSEMKPDMRRSFRIALRAITDKLTEAE